MGIVFYARTLQVCSQCAELSSQAGRVNFTLRKEKREQVPREGRRREPKGGGSKAARIQGLFPQRGRRTRGCAAVLGMSTPN